MGKTGTLDHIEVESIFIGVGCNRVVNAAAWGPDNLVAFGAHNAVAIFCPKTARILQMLPGHKGFLNCMEWLPRHQPSYAGGFQPEEKFLLTGSTDGHIILWAYFQFGNKWRKLIEIPMAHDKAVTCIAGTMLSRCEALFASSSSDCTVHIYSALFPMEAEGECKVSCLQNISIGLRAAVAVSLTSLPGKTENIILASGGLDNQIHLYLGKQTGQFVPVCSLKGHQDWIRSLDFSLPLPEGDGQAIYLASSSQDRNIRIWKLALRSLSKPGNDENIIEKKKFSLQMFIDGPVFKAGPTLWQVSMESLLVGHEDWVYSVRWQPPLQNCAGDKGEEGNSWIQPLAVLSASMDRTMMIWRPDSKIGIWMNEVTVGELGHSALGFYGGLWSPQGDAVLAHGFGGSFHLWRNVGLGYPDWQPQLVPSGHSAPVVDVAWAKTGQFLVSASHDQTTRLFASWDRSKLNNAFSTKSWHEIARPQVHGHDLNCLAILRGTGNHGYVSGAEEKVARVFEAPVSFLDTIEHTAEIVTAGQEKVRRDDVKVLGANMSALGLSQKPIYSQGIHSTTTIEVSIESIEAIPDALPVVLNEPPLEEHLAWNTLWPETHKLYGHGNEIFSMCCDHGGRYVATACKAQTASVAEIWLWHIGSWKVAGRLQSHTLTVTQMEFSHDDRFLLSVSRDRQFSLFKATKAEGNQEDQIPYKPVARIEAHKRIIWACSWSPCDRFFATGSRDKSVKLWVLEDSEEVCEVRQATSFPTFKSSITAVSWGPLSHFGQYVLAVGTEDGILELWKVQPFCSEKGSLTGSFCPVRIESFKIVRFIQFDAFTCHVASVNRLVWKEAFKYNDKEMLENNHTSFQTMQLASCGADHTVRLFNIKIS